MNAIPLKSLRSALSVGSAAAAPGGLKDFPGYAEADAAYRAAKDERRLREAQLREALSADNDKLLDLAAEAELRGEPADLVSGREEIERLQRRVAVAKRSEGIERERYLALRRRAVDALTRQHLPAYRAAVRKVAAQLYALHQANEACVAVLNELAAAGVTPHDGHFLPMAFYPAELQGGWGLGNSQGEAWVATARQQRFIEPEESLEDVARSIRR